MCKATFNCIYVEVSHVVISYLVVISFLLWGIFEIVNMGKEVVGSTRNLLTFLTRTVLQMIFSLYHTVPSLISHLICDVFQVTNFPDLALIKRYLSISNRRPLNLWLQSCYRKCFWIFVTTFGNFLLHLLKTALYIFTNLTCCNMY